MMLPISAPANEVYLFARVYSLGYSGMGLKLYLDPARLRLDGELEFRAEKYTVTPVVRSFIKLFRQAALRKLESALISVTSV